MNILWLKAFLLTQLLEMPVYVFGMGKEKSLPSRLAIAFGASALTHPIVWFVFPRLRPVGVSFVAMLVVAEIFAVVAEAFYLRWCGVRRAFLWSLLANAFSVAIGLAIRFWG